MISDFEIKILESNSDKIEAEIRLGKALNILINLNDINDYEQQKNDI